MPEPRPHLVRWLDACDALPEWTPSAEARLAPVEVVSAGLLVEGDGCITLLTSVTGDGHWSGGITIPLGCIVEVEELR